MKVPAHQDRSLYADPVERWVLKGNSVADHQAMLARMDIPGDMQQCWQQMVGQHNRQVQHREVLQKVFLQVGKRAVKKGSTDPGVPQFCEELAPQRTDPGGDPDAMLEVSFHPMPPQSQHREDMPLGPCGEATYEWLVHLQNAPNAEPLWMTTYQLLISFQMYAKRLGPKPDGAGWCQGDTAWPHGFDFNFLLQAKWLGKYLKYFAKSLGKSVITGYRRPNSTERIQIWCHCFRIMIPREELALIDEKLASFRMLPYKALTKDFSGFPPAF